jgi:hypothetical protein
VDEASAPGQEQERDDQPGPTRPARQGSTDPFPPTGNGPCVPGWSPAATGQRTRAAWSGYPCRAGRRSPLRGVSGAIANVTSRTSHSPCGPARG